MYKHLKQFSDNELHFTSKAAQSELKDILKKLEMKQRSYNPYIALEALKDGIFDNEHLMAYGSLHVDRDIDAVNLMTEINQERISAGLCRFSWGKDISVLLKIK